MVNLWLCLLQLVLLIIITLFVFFFFFSLSLSLFHNHMKRRKLSNILSPFRYSYFCTSLSHSLSPSFFLSFFFFFAPNLTHSLAHNFTFLPIEKHTLSYFCIQSLSRSLNLYLTAIRTISVCLFCSHFPSLLHKYTYQPTYLPTYLHRYSYFAEKPLSVINTYLPTSHPLSTHTLGIHKN